MPLIWDSPEAIGHFLSTRGAGAPFPGSYTALGWADDETGRLIAGLAFYDCNGRSCSCSLAIDGGVFPRPLIRAGLTYAFLQLKLARLTFLIEESNLPSQHLVRRFGAVHEATLRDAGKSGNMLIFALFPEDCKLWSKLNGQRRRVRTGST